MKLQKQSYDVQQSLKDLVMVRLACGRLAWEVREFGSSRGKGYDD